MASTLTDALSNEEWLVAARQSLSLSEDDDLRLLEVTAVTTPGGDGDVQGFLGETLPVRVRVQAGEEEPKEVALFMKVVPSDNPARTAFAADSRSFIKESGFFELMERLSARLRAGALHPWGPRCFVAKEQLLLFDDLSVQGYSTLGMRNTLDFPHCAAALDAVAHLHAASLAIEETDRRVRGIKPWQLGERFAETLQETLFTDVPNLLSKFFVVGLKPIKTIISLMPEYRDSPRYKEILDKVDKLPKVAYDVVKPSDKHRNVLCHGDLWVNNIMFRNSSWGQVAEARLVDYQLTRYAPPALDVEMLLHLCTRRAFRDARAAELRAGYYESLDKALADAGMDIDELLPRDDFLSSCRLGAMFGRIATATYFPGDLLPTEVMRGLLASPDDFERYITGDRSALVRDAFARDEYYRERMRETIGELVDNLLLADDAPF